MPIGLLKLFLTKIIFRVLSDQAIINVIINLIILSKILI